MCCIFIYRIFVILFGEDKCSHVRKYDECNVLKCEVVPEGNPSILEITNVSKGFSVIGMCIIGE